VASTLTTLLRTASSLAASDAVDSDDDRVSAGNSSGVHFDP
jgi:hypothetical protein